MRRIRFDIWSLVVLAVITMLSCAWVTYSLEWIRRRHALLGQVHFAIDSLDETTAPCGLWLFGELGFAEIYVPKATQFQQAKELFPEAVVSIHGQPSLEANREPGLATSPAPSR